MVVITLITMTDGNLELFKRKVKVVAFQHFKRGSHLVKSRINARQNRRRKARKLGKNFEG